MINRQHTTGTPKCRTAYEGWSGHHTQIRDIPSKPTGYMVEFRQNMVSRDLAAAGYKLSRAEFKLAWSLAEELCLGWDMPKAQDLIEVIEKIQAGEIIITG